MTFQNLAKRKPAAKKISKTKDIWQEERGDTSYSHKRLSLVRMEAAAADITDI